MSIDVEDGINILMRDIFNIELPPNERVVRNVNAILDLFEVNNVRGTFFILGEIAVAYPGLVRSIMVRGHELGVHGFYHDQIFKLDREKAHESIFRAKSVIEGISGKQVFGFRAPAFSINKNTAWVLEVISELGFKYDSSIMPVSSNRYGWPGFNKEIVFLKLQNGMDLIEVPLTTVQFAGRTFPACGGGYLRHLPYFITKRALSSVQNERPAVVYLHPYELDTERYPDYFYNARSATSFRHRLPLLFYRLNKSSVMGKLRKIVQEYEFTTAINVIEDLEARHMITVKYL